MIKGPIYADLDRSVCVRDRDGDVVFILPRTRMGKYRALEEMMAVANDIVQYCNHRDNIE